MTACHGGQCHFDLLLIALISLNLSEAYWLILRMQSVWGRDCFFVFIFRKCATKCSWSLTKVFSCSNTRNIITDADLILSLI